MSDFSDFIIYADESGDHSLVKIDEGYPIFVLCLCVFDKASYLRRIVPAVHAFKFKWFGHDTVILHEREIRKKLPPFEFLNVPDRNKSFLEDLNALLAKARVWMIASVIDKRRLKYEYLFDENPYHLALSFCVERTVELMEKRGNGGRTLHFVFERRGNREDKALELEFRRIVGGGNVYQRKLPNFEIVFVDKKANAAGMQIADLTARPIGLKVLRPAQPNRAFDIIAGKMVHGRGDRPGLGRIRIFP
ncbi:DUF3800 domain-containing protein [Rhodoplanes azumiensis]|uniref:DUF3800 domain-containing protein n=1 Tax=Rhodoplanes azumiensis TaxID=1897628 RepID=A0ABW5APH1_9BRAD